MRLNYNNGYYEGDVKDGKAHGRGKRVWDDGDVYEGDYVDGERSGKGKYTCANGAVYEGAWKAGKKHGKGHMTNTNGGTFEGTWENGQRCGKGCEVWGEGKWKGDFYEGSYKDDKRNGNGKYTYANGSVYVGEWKDDKKHGKGKYIYKSGSVYEGEWKDNKKHGKGKFAWLDGTVYEGDFADDEPSGKGVKTYTDGTEISGDWTGWDDAEDAVRKNGKTVECGSFKKGEFIPDEVEEYAICRITDGLFDLCGGDADKFEASPEFEASINKLMLTLISGEECESRAAARESAERLKEMSRCLTRLIERAEIGLTKLSEEDYKSFRKDILSDDGDK